MADFGFARDEPMPLDNSPRPAGSRTLPLEDIQGNVVQGYNFPCATYLFARFVSDPALARAWLGSLLDQVTPGTPWPTGQKPTTVFNLAFTHLGLAALGVPTTALVSFPAEYRYGMATQAADLGDTGDSAPDKWDFGGPRTPAVHCLLAVLGRAQQAVADRVAEVKAGFRTSVVEVYSLPAAALQPDPRREHFGYRDGFGQPSIAGSGIAAIPGQGTPLPGAGWADLEPGEFLLGHEDESGGFAPPLPQPPELTRNGTFLVVRKLYQDVARFRRFLKEQAAAVLGADTRDNREWLASRLVGRWRSGAPVALTPDLDDPTLVDDWNRNTNFDYRDDPLGQRCPVGAHIRRVNPRGSLPPTHVVQAHRLLRRGLPYGPPLLPEDRIDDDGVDRGVVFMALNASILRQFRFVQKLWINDGEFAASAGLTSSEQDPIAGPQDRGGQFLVYLPNGDPAPMFDLPRFVRVRGGGYFLVPSLTGLRLLAAGVPN